jgi:hypothetical protein
MRSRLLNLLLQKSFFKAIATERIIRVKNEGLAKFLGLYLLDIDFPPHYIHTLKKERSD